ncbi:MAG: hypothetical protein DRG78_13165 [Epsilonproteobacteria bacterium]|nr:MAG: hypothetical protein DRG78_13165 [Campylobacterota bacterium]
MDTNTVIYDNGEIELKVSDDKDTIWASINDITKVFDIDRSVVSRHIKNIFKDKELDEEVVCADFAHTTKHGSLSDKTQTRDIKYYNLDIVLAVGYRTNSTKAIHFRRWATSVLKSYITNGYTINSDKITNDRFVSLENQVQLISSKLNILENKNLKPSHGIFYNGQMFDAHNFISDIIRDTKKSIKLIDNYVDVYHIGVSLKDLGKKWFAFSRFDVGAFGLLGRLK